MILTGDIGGSSIRLALWNEDKIIKYLSFPTENNYDKDLKNIAKHLTEFQTEQTENKIEIAVFAIAGSLNASHDALINSINLTSWQNREIVKDLHAITNSKVIIENDTYCAALAEKKYHQEAFWYVNWGTGIGGCLVLENGSIKASEIGHTSLNILGDKCRCGQIGCWDSLVSGKSIELLYGKDFSKITDVQWRELVDTFSKGLINLYLSYPADIVVNGGVILKKKELLEYIKESMNRGITIVRTRPRLSLAHNEDLAGIKGAHILAL